MTNYQETVDGIRSFIESGNRAQSEAVAEYSEQYARACQEVNDRLRKCNDALRRNLRGDAIHLAEAEPNLLDLVALLDFPGLHDWKETCCLLPELTPPPDLLIEMATALNEAYATEQPLQSLMSYHRLLALARASIRERLTVMRRLAELDPASSFWDDDIRTFERARLEEMRSQLNIALKTKDAAAVGRLNDEAGDSSWRVAVPQDLRRLLQGSAARLTADQSVAELRQLLPKLNEAYGAMAFEDCKTIVAKWLALVAATHLTVPADLQEQIDPVLGWVREEDERRRQQAEFEQACNALQQAIDTDQPTSALERAYQNTLQFHLDIPQALDTRYRQRLIARALSTKHRRRLLYVCISAGFILVAGAGAWFANQNLVSHEINDAQRILASALTDVQQGEPDKGQSLRKQLLELHPRILRSAVITKTLSDLDRAVATEREREQNFQQHLQAAVAAGVEKPNDAELQQAIALERAPADHSQISEFKSRLDAYRSRMQQETDRQFVADGQAISKDVEQKLTAALMATNPDDYARQTQAFGKRVETLRQQPGVSAGLKDAQLSALDAILARRQKELDDQQTTRRMLEGIRTFGKTADAHATALKQFIATCPDDPHCASFQRAVDQLPSEQAVETWSNLVSHWGSQMMPANYQAAKDRAAEVKQYLDQYPSTPLIAAVQSYQAYLNLGLGVASPDGPWKGKLRDLLKNPLVSSLRYLDTNKGVRYYVTSTVQVQSNELDGVVKGQHFEAVTSPDVTHPKMVELRKDLLKSSTPARSPQALFADAAGARIEALDYPDWDVTGLDLLTDILSRQSIHPVLRAILLQHILQLDQPAASWSERDAFGKVADALVEQNVEDMEWLDPEHVTDPDALAKLQSIIEKLPPLPKARTEVLNRRNAVLKSVQINTEGLGILLKTGSDFEIVTTVPAAVGQLALVVGTDKSMVEVGHAKEKRWLVDDGKAAGVPDGSLVFIVAPPK